MERNYIFKLGNTFPSPWPINYPWQSIPIPVSLCVWSVKIWRLRDLSNSVTRWTWVIFIYLSNHPKGPWKHQNVLLMKIKYTFISKWKFYVDFLRSKLVIDSVLIQIKKNKFYELILGQQCLISIIDTDGLVLYHWGINSHNLASI